MNSKSKKLLENTGLFLIGSIGSKFVQFFLVPLYTYTMTSSEYGTSDLLLTTVNFLMPFFSFQLSDALLRFGLDKKISQEDTINSIFRILMFGTILSIIMSPILYLSESLGNFISFFIIILNLRIYRDILSIILKIQDKNKIFSIDSMLYTFTLCFSSFILLSAFKLGITGYFISYIIANVISIIFILLYANINPKVLTKKIDKDLSKKIIIYSLPMIVNSVSYWITTASDRYMINFFLNVASVGIYAVASKVPTFISTFTGIFNQAWMISSINEYENDRDTEFYSKVFNFYCGISFMGCSLLILIIKPFMHMYVSSEYFIAWQGSTILILSAVFSGICAFINGIFYAYKKNLSATITTVTGAIANIILNSILIPKFGVMGASIATLVSWIIILYVRLISIKKILPLRVKWNKIIFYTTIILIEIICVFIFNNYSVYLINLILSFMILYCEKDNLFSIFKTIKSKLSKIKQIMRKKIRKKFDKKNQRRLINDNFTIISSNCTGGVIYHNLNKKFMSPTINVYFEAKDFIKFCNNLDHYLNFKIQEEKSDCNYPVIKIDDIKIYAVHYKNFDEFKEKWIARSKRINKENIFIIMTERDGCEYSDVIAFDKLKYKNKIIFTHKKYKEIKSSYYVPGTENKNSDKSIHKTRSLTDYKGKMSGFRYIDDFDYVNWLNGRND